MSAARSDWVMSRRNGDALVCCVKKMRHPHGKIRSDAANDYTQWFMGCGDGIRTRSTQIISLLHSHLMLRHNGESTAGVRVERTFSLPNPSHLREVTGIEPAFMPCSSMLSPVVLITIHPPRFGSATLPGQMQRAVTLPFGLLVWAVASGAAARGLLTAPGSPRYCLARNLRETPSTLSAFAMFFRYLREGC